MRITKVSGATPQLPVTIDDAKMQVRELSDEEDSLLAHYLRTAVQWAEEETRRAIMQRSYLIVRDGFPTPPWDLPLGKIQSITKVEYIDTDGITQDWTQSPPLWEFDNDSDHKARLRPKSGESWPTTGSYLSSARVEVIAGWTVADVPNTVKQGILLKFASLFESRAPGDPSGSDVEAAAKILLSSWKLPVFA